MFGTSGIRGKYGELATPELAERVGNAIGRAGKPVNNRGRTPWTPANPRLLVALAMDARSTSPVLAGRLSAGAMLAGSDVLEIGMAPTPLLAYATWKEKCSGAMITASHNPPEYNGIKLFYGGMEYTREMERETGAAIGKNGKAVAWDRAGQARFRDYSGEYVSFLLSKADAAAVGRRKPRALVDAGNAAACHLAPALLEAAGCEVVRLNCDSPGKPARNLEPKAETLGEAAKAVVRGKCDFGVAFDGDGDRAIAIDEKGRVLALDVQLAVFCSHFLREPKVRGRLVVSTVEASLCVRETVESLGGKLLITPVGSLHVAQQVLGKKAVFGGEPCGEYVFPGSIPCADGLLASLVLAEMFCKRGTLSALADAIRTYPIERRKFACDEAKKRGAMEKIRSSLRFEGATLSTIDGLRYDFEDGWLLVRPSGTEPAIRMTCEFRSERRRREIAGRAEDEIGKACR